MIKIPGRFPTLNEIINTARTNRFASSSQKKRYTEYATYFFKGKRFDGVLDITFVWYRNSLRGDLDNISAGKKFILDAMQKAGAIENDSVKYIRQTHDFFEKSTDERVEIYIQQLIL